MSVRVSVIIPVFNAEPHLARCLDGIVSQEPSAENHEIIVVDNNSTDGSLALAERHEAVRVLKEAKQGAYAARNTGIRAAKGDILAFLDPDCVPAKDWLASISRAFSVDRRGIVLGKRYYQSSSRYLQLLSDYDSTLAAHIYSGDKPDSYFGYCNNMAVRRSLLTEQQGFHEILRGADTVFVHNAVATHGCEIVDYDPNIRVTHLEIEGVADFYRKRMYYGTSNERTRELGTSRPLTNPERFEVYFETVRSRSYSVRQATELLALLSLGVAFYSLGRWRGRIG